MNLSVIQTTKDVGLLKKLSDDEYWEVRDLVASNPNCPIELLEKLSHDEEKYVRCAVAYNNNCHVDVLKKLSDDKELYVREAAIESLKTRMMNK